MAFNQDVKALLPKRGVVDGFLAYWLVGMADQLLRLVTEATHGTKKIETGELAAYPIALPGESEQRRIAQVLAETDTRIDGERSTAAKLRECKSGLMSELLTGHVRFPEFLEAAGG